MSELPTDNYHPWLILSNITENLSNDNLQYNLHLAWLNVIMQFVCVCTCTCMHASVSIHACIVWLTFDGWVLKKQHFLTESLYVPDPHGCWHVICGTYRLLVSGATHTKQATLTWLTSVPFTWNYIYILNTRINAGKLADTWYTCGNILYCVITYAKVKLTLCFTWNNMFIFLYHKKHMTVWF